MSLPFLMKLLLSLELLIFSGIIKIKNPISNTLVFKNEQLYIVIKIQLTEKVRFTKHKVMAR